MAADGSKRHGFVCASRQETVPPTAARHTGTLAASSTSTTNALPGSSADAESYVWCTTAGSTARPDSATSTTCERQHPTSTCGTVSKVSSLRPTWSFSAVMISYHSHAAFHSISACSILRRKFTNSAMSTRSGSVLCNSNQFKIPMKFKRTCYSQFSSLAYLFGGQTIARCT